MASKCLEEPVVQTTSGEQPMRGMVVDADPDVLEFAGATLEQAGYSIVRAGSAGDALREMLLCRGSVDFVVVDYDLDGSRWSEVAAAARTLFPDARLLTTTRRGIAAEDRGSLDDVLTKPFTAAELLEKVEALVGAEAQTSSARDSQKDEAPLTAMVVGLNPADYRSLARIFALEGWELRRAAGIHDAIVQQYTSPARLILAQNNSDDGSWRVLMDRFGWQPYGPRIIVASRLADERLWAEVLNLGAFDIVSLPFDEREVRHVVSHAWSSWRYQWSRRDGMDVNRGAARVDDPREETRNDVRRPCGGCGSVPRSHLA